MVVCTKKVSSLSEIDTFWWFFTKCHSFATFFLKFGQNPKTWQFAQKNCQFWRDRHVFVVFHNLPQVLELYAKNLVKTLKHGSLHKKVASFGEIDTFLWFFTKGKICLQIVILCFFIPLCTFISSGAWNLGWHLFRLQSIPSQHNCAYYVTRLSLQPHFVST